MPRRCPFALALLVLTAVVGLRGSAALSAAPQAPGVIRIGAGEMRWCTSDPEGVVTAPAGSLCLESDGQTWRKASGSGNTGWVEIPTSAGGGSGIAWQVQATDAGALCDGATDDTAALQTATDALDAVGGGDLILPIGQCIITDTWTIGSPGGDYSHINLIGQSEDSTDVRFNGTKDRPALFADHVSYAHWKGFGVSTGVAAEDRGTAIGILIGSAGGAGTQSTGLSFEHVAVSGFHYGMMLGSVSPSVASASEFTCRFCRASSNNVGFAWSDYNTLNLRFFDVDLIGNVRGMEIGGDGTYASQVGVGPMVVGGATASNSDCDFCFGNPFDAASIISVRAEPANRFVTGAVYGPLVLRSNTINPSQNVDRILVELDGLNSTLNITDNSMLGKVSLASALVDGDTIRGALTMTNNFVMEGTTGYPVVLPTRSDSGLALTLTNNSEIYCCSITAHRVFPNRTGLWVGKPTASWYPRIEDDLNADAGYPLSPLALSRVRSLALGTSVVGSNLRDSVTFASAGTAAFTFSRTVSVDTDGSSTIAFSSGAIRAIDVGKQIILPDATDDCGYSAGAPTPTDDVDAVVTSITDATHAVVQGRQWATWANRCRQEITRTLAGISAVVGQDEPDANYFVDGLVCDSNEIISIDSSSASGITFRSSNATSTATCTFSIKR